jgi:hypothetical protein
MKAKSGVEVQLHLFLTSALDGNEWVASRPGSFTPKETNPRYALNRRIREPVYMFWKTLGATG